MKRTTREWIQVVIAAAAAIEDEVAFFLAEQTGRGIETRAGEVVGYFTDEEWDEKRERELRLFLENLPGEPGQPPLAAISEIRRIDEEDWADNWKHHFQVNKSGRYLVIKPSWEKYEPAPEEQVIEIDPAMAFGTGAHASTRMALELLDNLFHPPQPVAQQVLDLGTGTAILAMAAAKLGAAQVLALDNDPEAVAAARENVARNGLTDRITVADSSLEELAACSFDLIMANITHDILTELAPDLCRLLAPGGLLILSGILAGDQAASIEATYEKLGLAPEAGRRREEWAALQMRKIN